MNEEYEMNQNPVLAKLNEGKWCIRQCAREFIPIEDDKVKIYCPGCERVVRILQKKKNYKNIE